jgi:transposase-like protein
MDANLSQAIFTDEATARKWLESHLWLHGPVCPHCGADRENITGLRGKAHRPGVYQCNACRQQFTVTVKTVFEKSRIPLSKWLTTLFLMTASKQPISAHHIHGMLGISYKSTWFMCHRLCEAMRAANYPHASRRTAKAAWFAPSASSSDGPSRLPRPRKRQSLNREYNRDDAHASPTPELSSRVARVA